MTTDDPRCPYCVEGDGFKLLTVVGDVLYCDRCGHQSLPGNPGFVCYCLRWKDANGTWVKTCTILTTTPNAVTSTIRDRMPVILDPADYDVWLDPGMRDTDAVSELLKPFEATAMRCYPVSSRVNNVQNDDDECARPVTLETPPQQPLFPS